jgi:glycosyltransferase involved in cell wall biosynthesis
MILVDSVFINNGGGEILFNYLVSNLFEKHNCKDLFFLYDKRYKNINFNKHNSYVCKNNLQRIYFYYKYRNKIKKIFIFSGIPIYVFKKNINIYIYIQNTLFFNKKNFLKFLYFKLFLSSKYNIILQTKTFSKQIISIIPNLSSNNFLYIPFFDDSLINRKFDKYFDNKNLIFFYPSSGEKHKNHKNLFLAFNIIAKKYSNVKLYITLSNNYTELLDLINQIDNKSIINIGFVNHNNIRNIYNVSSAIIFPSFTESFGLPLIEGCLYKLPILASNLDYVNEIISTNYLFNPYNIDDIICTIEKFINDNKNRYPAILNTHNKITDLTKILINE